MGGAAQPFDAVQVDDSLLEVLQRFTDAAPAPEDGLLGLFVIDPAAPGGVALLHGVNLGKLIEAGHGRKAAIAVLFKKAKRALSRATTP